jgi:hypothetical protein
MNGGMLAGFAGGILERAGKRVFISIIHDYWSASDYASARRPRSCSNRLFHKAAMIGFPRNGLIYKTGSPARQVDQN